MQHRADGVLAMDPAASSSPPFFKLPNELTLDIVSHLLPTRGFLPFTDEEVSRRTENARRVKGLHGLTLACRRLHKIANEFLYHNVILEEINTEALLDLENLHLDSMTNTEFLEYGCNLL
jgi:hypothetical protein